MTRFAIRHLTCFKYEEPVHFSQSNLRLEPIAWPGQTLVSHSITINPGGQLAPAPLRSALVNLTRLIIPGATTSLEIISESLVSVERTPQLSWLGEPSIAEVGRLARESVDNSDLSPANFLYPSSFIPMDAAIADWSAEALAGDALQLDVDRVDRGHALRPEDLLEDLAGQVLHHEEQLAVVRATVVVHDRAVGVVQVGGDAGAAGETFGRGLFGGGQDLDGDDALGTGLPGLPDRGVHAADADQLTNAIAPTDELAREILDHALPIRRASGSEAGELLTAL